MNRKIAAKILEDRGPETNIDFSTEDLRGLFDVPRPTPARSLRERRDVRRFGRERDRPLGFPRPPRFGPGR